MANLVGKVCLVTGASRGIGRGIALQLGQAGATVYITGRSPGPLTECAREVSERGGKGIAVPLDHGNDSDVAQLFDRIDREQQGRLDVLVNNAYAGVNMIFENTGKPFWETQTPEMWDAVNGVGLRGHYICSVYAARLMVPRQSGLIVNVSSGGGLRYLFNVPYGVGKAGCDRMAADMAVELRKTNVAAVSLWPGAVQTETIKEKILDNPDAPKKSLDIFSNAESVEYAGMAVAHLAADPNMMAKTGKILLVSHLAREYGFTDVDGQTHDMLKVNGILKNAGWTRLAGVIPDFVRIPMVLLHYASYKF